MSRVGKTFILVPKEVKVSKDMKNFYVTGPLGSLIQKYSYHDIKIKILKNMIYIIQINNNSNSSAMQGLYRSLFYNMIIGVTKGFEKSLEIVGIGYRAVTKSDNIMELYLGYSHNIIIKIPQEVSYKINIDKGKNTIIVLKSYDKQLLGVVASKIRSLRKPDSYKGKGIRYINEYIKMKTGKTSKST